MSVNNPILQQFITNNTTQVFNEPTPVGASWEWQGTTGECESGKFVTNSIHIAETTRMEISSISKAGSDSSYIRKISVGNILRFTDAQGKTAAFAIDSMVPSGDGCNVAQVSLIHDENISVEWGDWAGIYIADSQPAAGA